MVAELTRIDAQTGVLRTLLADDVLAGIAPVERARLEQALEVVDVVGGDVIIRQGDAADAAYVLLRGRLRVSRDGRVIADLAPGEMFGEFALLSDQPRGATVVAVRDSELLKLPTVAFVNVAREHPDLLLRVCSVLLNRTTGNPTTSQDKAASPAVRTIALVPAGTRAPRLTECARAIVRSLAVHGTATTVHARAGARHDDVELTAWLSRLEDDHRFVVYLADPNDTAWTRRCVRQADRVLLVGASGAPPARGAAEVATHNTHARCELVLLDGAGPPTGTGDWLALRPHVAAHHHIRSTSDYARVARALAGRSVGVVLGGGGPRGFAHLGVLRALEQFGIPVDAAGGTSAGAVMAASVATGWDDRARCERAAAIFGKRKAIIDLTLPLVSLSPGRKLTNMFRSDRAFADLAIENLPLPFFAVAADLDSADTAVLDRGPLWFALRASTAQPGVFPPVCYEGRLLVDGGVVDDLPISTMRSRIDGTVIGVELQPPSAPGARQPFGPSLSGWRVLADRLHPRRAPATPGLVSILLQAKEVGGRRAMRAALAADPPDLLLRPPTADVDPLDFTNTNQHIEAGYRSTCEVLERSPIAAQLAIT